MNIIILTIGIGCLIGEIICLTALIKEYIETKRINNAIINNILRR